MSNYLSEEEVIRFKEFVRSMNLSYRDLAELLKRKSQQGIFVALKKNRIKRESVRMIREELKTKISFIENI